MITTVRTKCKQCGQWNGFKAVVNPYDYSHVPLRVETCKNCNSIVASPKTIAGPHMMPSERKVAEFLDALGLPWIFEFPVFIYDDRKRPRVWTPDFFIPKLGIYIEVCGSKDFNYEYREKICITNNILIIFIHLYKTEKYWKKFLFRRLKEVEEQRHTEATKLMENVPAEISVNLE
jgi:hypothetical protein